jgi:hypothetical protein
VAFFYGNKQGDRLGSKRFVGQLEEKLGRVLRSQKGGRPKKQKNQDGFSGFPPQNFKIPDNVKKQDLTPKTYMLTLE